MRKFRLVLKVWSTQLNFWPEYDYEDFFGVILMPWKVIKRKDFRQKINEKSDFSPKKSFLLIKVFWKWPQKWWWHFYDLFSTLNLEREVWFKTCLLCGIFFWWWFWPKRRLLKWSFCKSWNFATEKWALNELKNAPKA